VWPWIRGATAYPVRFAMDHPLRSAALGYVAAGGDLPESLSAIEGGRDAIFDRRMEDMPPWLREAYQVGETVVDGETFPSVLNTGPLSPVSTAYDTVASALGLAGSRNLWEMTNPGIQAGQRILSGETPWGQETGRIEAITSNLERLVPNIGLVGGLINPEGGGLYPEDATRLGRLKRAMRIFPYAIDPDEAFEAAVREGTAEAKKTPKRDPRADDLAWIKKHPEVIHPSYAPYAERYQRLYNAFLASKKALANKLDLDSVEQLGRRREYAIKLGVLMRDRPELFRDAPRSQYWEAFRSYFDLGVTDATGHHLTQEQERMLAEYTGWINSVFQFEDVLGAKIETIVDRARAEVDAKIANSVVVGG
jgi:hypothetical protein